MEGVLSDWNNQTTSDTCLPAAEQCQLQPDTLILEMNFSAAHASFHLNSHYVCEGNETCLGRRKKKNKACVKMNYNNERMDTWEEKSTFCLQGHLQIGKCCRKYPPTWWRSEGAAAAAAAAATACLKKSQEHTLVMDIKYNVTVSV